MVFSLEYKIYISIYVQYLLITSKNDCNKYLSDSFSLFSFVNYAPVVIKTFLQSRTSCIIFFTIRYTEPREPTELLMKRHFLRIFKVSHFFFLPLSPSLSASFSFSFQLILLCLKTRLDRVCS